MILLAACLLAVGGSCAAPLPAAPAAAAKTPRVALSARFAPDKPGSSTTVYYRLTISEPQPLRLMELRLPAGMGLARSSLGLEQCSPTVLFDAGPAGCPPDSFIGHGQADGKLVGEEAIEEHAGVTVIEGPSVQGRPTMLFFLEAIRPVSEERILYAHLLPTAPPFGDVLRTEVPLISSWPGGPDVGLVSLASTIGPNGLQYHYTAHGKRIDFTPRGLDVPEHCPARGYPVQIRLRWWNIDRSATATTRVPCGKG